MVVFVRIMTSPQTSTLYCTVYLFLPDCFSQFGFLRSDPQRLCSKINLPVHRHWFFSVVHLPQLVKMGVSIYSLINAIVLCLNALAILSESRFLSKFGLATPSAMQGGVPRQDSVFSDYSPTGFDSDTGMNPGSGGARGSSIKLQVASLLHSVRLLLRWPLIFANIVFVVLALVFG